MLVLRRARTSSLRALLALSIAGAAASPGAARAQGTEAEQRAAAQALFDQANQLMDQKRFDDACPKLEEVVRLQPGGVGAKLALAECYDAGGKLASAWASYLAAETAAAKAGQADRAAKAHARAAALAPRLARLTIVVPDAVKGLRGLEVQRDGLPVGAATWGVPLPVDKGRHVVSAAAAGKEPFSAPVDVTADGQTLTVSVASLRDAGLSAASAPAPAPPPVARPTPTGTAAPRPVAAQAPNAAPAHAPSPGGVPAWAWASGAVGLAFAGAAVAVGVDGLGAFGTLKDACGADLACPKGYADKDALNARKDRDLAMAIAFGGAGAVALSAAVIGIVGAPKTRPAATGHLEVLPVLGAEHGGVVLAGAF
jgi:hypothetical protein